MYSFLTKRIINKKYLTLTKGTKLLRNRFLTTGSNILVSDSSDVEIPNATIPEFIIPKLEQYEKYVASESAETGRSYTFGQVRKKTKNLAKALRGIFKLEKSDVVAVILPNCPEFLITTLGIFEAGLILTTLNPIYTPEEIAKQLTDSSAKVLVTKSDSINTARAAIKLTKRNIPIIAIKRTQNESLPEGVIDFEELVNVNLDLPNADYGNPKDVVFLPYSSGTTGMPKGVELTHYSILANLRQIGHKDFNFFDEPTDSYQDVTAAVLPLFHIYGFTINLLNVAINGAKAVTLEKFTPDLYISVLKKNNVTILYVAPPLVLFFASHPEVKGEYFNQLKKIVSGGAPLGESDEERFIKKVGREVRIFQAYGMTEASPVITYSPKTTNRNKSAGSVGKPICNTLIKFIDPDDPSGTPLGPGQSGELLCKGPQVMKGYHKREDETKKSFLDGWLRTGDIGHYNEDKFIFITDRAKELIKVKGFQVAPAELEAVLRDCPSVEDAAVIGIPHPKHGEVPRAYIVKKQNASLNIDELKEFVAKKVAPYKKLEGGIQILEAIPKNASGKILRRQLKTDFEKNGI